ncbi:MAG: phosphoglycerol transferase MdoB-like AlkP superfamily enzyme [Flavobacteriales bacterium]|jgi:phosphoglycerol transferase MdoB-like AlkP superfamily enzyme
MSNRLNSIAGYIRLVYLVAAIFVLIRILEFAYASFALGHSFSFDLLVTRSINFDTLLVILAFTFAFIPIAGLNYFNQRIGKVLAGGLALCMIVSNLLLTQYFLTNHSLLGCVLFSFSFQDILNITSNEVTLNRIPMLLGALGVLILSTFGVVRVLSVQQDSRKINLALLGSFLIVCPIALANSSSNVKSIVHFDNRYEYFIGNSKHMYLLASCEEESNIQSTTLDQLIPAISAYHKATPYFNYSDSLYPLIHNEPYENVLGPYFPNNSQRPNIVLVISESLSCNYSGSNTRYAHSLTPFVDSLANAGLYWTTFLSNAERSYGALPSILSSLPSGVGNRGIMNMNLRYSNLKRFPKQTGLIELLNQHGYRTGFFYGGWGNYDNVGSYLKEIGIDDFISMESFETDKYQVPEGGWGYHDMDLYVKSLDVLSGKQLDQPYFNVYQTITMHTPFNMCEPEYFDSKFVHERLAELGYVSNERPNLQQEVLASIFFADDALRHLFMKLSKRDDFERTIFIITGDHALDQNLTDHHFESFHIPLVIYSPMMNRSAVFKGACSHIDITPSILALFKENFAFDIPEEKHWIGRGLDTSSTTQFNRFIPLLINSTDVPNFIFSDTVMFANEVWSIDSSLSLKSAVSDSSSGMRRFFNSYRKVNAHVCRDDRIWKNEE